MSSHKIVNAIQFFADSFKFSSDIELNSLAQFLVSKTEGKKFHDAKELFDSAYALSCKIEHQHRHFILCLQVSNNVTNNYRSCQVLYDFIQLSIQNTTKDPLFHDIA